MIFKRAIQNSIEQYMFKGKIILIYGARQVGKTTLCKQILEKYEKTKKTAYYNCESLEVKIAFETTSETALKKAIDGKELIVLDEAQYIKNIGLTLKIIRDMSPEICIIASGSSSFDLANQVGAPLIGRAIPFTLYPFSVKEIQENLSMVEVIGKMDDILLMGLYPEIFNSASAQAQKSLFFITGSYLYKDILAVEDIRNSNKLLELLQLLALQVGSEVSFSEIGQKLSMSHTTVSKYIDLLEKNFIIFKLRAFSKNLRKEISKSVKIYFYDLGIRNALIQTFTPIKLRLDAGALWENFCILERRKNISNLNLNANQYFYRTFLGEEVDYVEETNGQIAGYEIKFSKETIKQPSNFIKKYSAKNIEVVNKKNWTDFLI